MLGRTANDLFWLARYMERAESMARLVEVGTRIVLVPGQAEDHHEEWRSTLESAGCAERYFVKYDTLTTRAVINHLLFDPANPSSVYACLQAARRNARAQRIALTRDMWESLNSSWNTFAAIDPATMTSSKLPGLLDWIKERSALYRGTLLNTILRNDTFFFSQLGTFLERADNTARILHVKYYLLLPHAGMVGGTVDTFQWAMILRAVSALRSYRWVYRGEPFQSRLIAEYLILNKLMPRSLRAAYCEITAALDELATFCGERHACHDTAAETARRLDSTTIDAVLAAGLHEYLLDFVARNNRLGGEISEAYHFAA